MTDEKVKMFVDSGFRIKSCPGFVLKCFELLLALPGYGV